MRRIDSLEKTLMRMRPRGWHGWMASLTQWTWAWANPGSWWWTRRPEMLQSMGSQIVRHDWVTELNLWRRLVLLSLFHSCSSHLLPQWEMSLHAVMVGLHHPPPASDGQCILRARNDGWYFYPHQCLIQWLVQIALHKCLQKAKTHQKEKHKLDAQMSHFKTRHCPQESDFCVP